MGLILWGIDSLECRDLDQKLKKRRLSRKKEGHKREREEDIQS